MIGTLPRCTPCDKTSLYFRHCPDRPVYIPVAGAPGATGATGEKGDKGDQGDRGLTGPAGPVGPVGPAGPTGLTGDRGAQGLQGLVGPSGPAGSPGAAGPAGPTGSTGARGPKGDKGDKGDTGAASTVPGPAGPQGLVGPAGPAGAAGAAGATGATGATGPTGPSGPVGPVGPKGDKGDKGDPGSDAVVPADTMYSRFYGGSDLNTVGQADALKVDAVPAWHFYGTDATGGSADWYPYTGGYVGGLRGDASPLPGMQYDRSWWSITDDGESGGVYYRRGDLIVDMDGVSLDHVKNAGTYRDATSASQVETEINSGRWRLGDMWSVTADGTIQGIPFVAGELCAIDRNGNVDKIVAGGGSGSDLQPVWDAIAALEERMDLGGTNLSHEAAQLTNVTSGVPLVSAGQLVQLATPTEFIGLASNEAYPIGMCLSDTVANDTAQILFKGEVAQQWGESVVLGQLIYASDILEDADAALPEYRRPILRNTNRVVGWVLWVDPADDTNCRWWFDPRDMQYRWHRSDNIVGGNESDSWLDSTDFRHYTLYNGLKVEMPATGNSYSTGAIGEVIGGTFP